MGTTAQKLQRVLDTKEGLKDTINTYLGQDITSAIPFKDYETYIKNFYGSLPKTDYEEGSNITLENCLKGKLDFENDIVGYGDASQDSATGSNLMNTEKIVNGTYNGLTITKDSDDFINISGTATANTSIVLSEITYNFPSTLYISYENTFTTNTAQLSFLNGSTTLGGLTFSGANRTYDMSTILGGKTCTKIELYITSGNTINGKFRPMLNTQSGQTYSKYAFPNPSYPSPVNVVRGKNVLGFANSSSKSRLGLTFTWSNSSITVNGTSTNTETVFGDGVNLKPVKVEGTYKVSGYTRSDTFFQLYWKDKNGTIKYKEMKNNPTITFNEGDTLYQLFFFAAKNDILTYNNETFNLQLEKGTEVTAFLPYNTLEVKASNKNLLNITATTQTISGISMTINEDKSITLNGTAPSGGVEIPIGNCGTLKSGTYTGNCETNSTTTSYYIRLGEGEEQGSTWITNITHNSTFNLSTDKSAYARLIIRANVVLNNITIYPQVEPGSTATSFVEHQEQTYQLSLGEYEFAKIGNYVDTIEYDLENDKVYKNKAIDKKVLNGTETYNFTSENNRAYTNVISSTTKKPTSDNMKIGLLADYLQEVTLNNIKNTSTINGIALAQSGNLNIKIDGLTSANEYQAYITEHNLLLYYPLATALKEEITTILADQIKALYNSQSFTDTTIITSNGELPLVLKVRALKGE